MNTPPCHHTWHQVSTDILTVEGDSTTKRYVHRCPHCGYLKTTIRCGNKLPPDLKWKRELEKLMARAEAEYWRYTVNGRVLQLDEVDMERRVEVPHV